MTITDMMLQTMPSSRLYEFNLNYILQKIKEIDKLLLSDTESYLKQLFNENKLVGRLTYVSSNHSLDMEVILSE